MITQKELDFLLKYIREKECQIPTELMTVIDKIQVGDLKTEVKITKSYKSQITFDQLLQAFNLPENVQMFIAGPFLVQPFVQGDTIKLLWTEEERET